MVGTLMEQQPLDLIPVVACVIKYATPFVSLPAPGFENKPLLFDDLDDDLPKFLMGCRLPEKNYGSLWECPGGCVSGKETLIDTARRELKEELSLTINTYVLLPAFEIIIPGYHVKFLYVSVDEKVTMLLTAHSVVKTISLSKMHQYPLTPATAAFMIHLLQKNVEDLRSDLRDAEQEMDSL